MKLEEFFDQIAPKDKAEEAAKQLNDLFDKAPKHIGKALREFFDLISEMTRESDRGTVILATAQIDELLERLLKKVMLPPDTKKDLLFNPDRPLGTFSARMRLAHRLGLIDQTVLSALKLLRDVRDDFAHLPLSASLEVSPYQESVQRLTHMLVTDAALKKVIDEWELKYPSLINRQFFLSMIILVFNLLFILERVELTKQLTRFPSVQRAWKSETIKRMKIRRNNARLFYPCGGH